MQFDVQINQHKEDRKLTLINEQEFQNNQKQLAIKVLPSAKQQMSTKKFKRTTSIIDDDEYTYKGPFEDSRVTRMIFEKCRIIELTRFWLIVASVILNILEYEYSFSTYLTKNMENELNILLYLIFSMSIIIIFLTIISYQIELEYRKSSRIISQKATLIQTSLIWDLLVELIIIIPTSNPFTKDYYVTFNQRGSSEIRFYTINEILTYIMFFRLYLLLNIGFKFQSYYSNRIGRVCRLYQTRFGTHLMLKLCIRQFPFYTLSWLFIVGLIQYTYQLEIAERPLLRTFDVINYYNITKSLWVTMITIATVGYGDFFPYTDLGRISMTLGLFYGVTITSLFTAILYNMLQPVSGENKSWALLDKTEITKNMKKASSNIFFYFYQIKNKRKVAKRLEIQENFDNILFNLESHLSDVGIMRRMYRDIDGEEFMEMVKRKFGDSNHSFKDLILYLQKMMEQHQLILNNLEKNQDLQSFKLKSSQAKNLQYGQFSSPQSYQQKLNTEDKLSKDDNFFENLEESNRDSCLMSFHD
ncbi:unnamed protein product [Paramecium pentaurelia]|uniref:Potassium channel domain-containing protein n=1 Tax=Paramecium pentaurelia TaxID=43138 RepID=A0A8S1U1M7_9CILI|nr:unnamed protein product [Paramecium pentaurelia]